MKKIILLLSAVLLWALPVSVSAQNKNNDKAKQQRKEQFDRFCKFRRDFMMKQIGLSEQEAKQFFPLYEEMEGKKWTVDREARTFARKIVRSETAVSDVEYESGRSFTGKGREVGKDRSGILRQVQNLSVE